MLQESSAYKVEHKKPVGPIFRPPISIENIPLEEVPKPEVVPRSTTNSPSISRRTTAVPASNPKQSCWSPEKCCKYCQDLGFSKCVMRSCKKCQCDYGGGFNFNRKVTKGKVQGN